MTQNLLSQALKSKGVLSGLFALTIVALIALGCSCNDKLSKIGDEVNKAAANAAKQAGTKGVSTDDDSSDVELPNNDVVEGLVKETIQKFSDGVDSGDFQDLYDYSSPDFQSTYTVDEIKTAFKSYTANKKRVVPILEKVADTDAIFSSPAAIDTRQNLKVLKTAGSFPTKPFKVRFDFEYVMRDGEWKLLKMVINIP